MWLLLIIVPLLIWLDLHLFRIFYGLIFRNDDDFINSLKYTFTPDIFSLFKGEYFKDSFAEFKLSGFLLLCAVTLFIEVFLVRALINLF